MALLAATMSTETPLSRRDRAVLAAVAAGRGAVSGGTLLIDGRCCADQFAVIRLVAAGLLDRAAGPARLTATGLRMILAAA